MGSSQQVVVSSQPSAKSACYMDKGTGSGTDSVEETGKVHTILLCTFLLNCVHVKMTGKERESEGIENRPREE